MLSIEQKQGFLLVKPDKDIAGSVARQFFEDINRLHCQPVYSVVHTIVVDCRGKVGIDFNGIRTLSQLSVFLRERGRKLCLVRLDRQTDVFVKAQGLNVKVYKTLDELLIMHAKKMRSMAGRVDADFINPFVDAAIQTLRTLCSVEFVPGEPVLKSVENDSSLDIAGVIALTAEAFKGSISLGFPSPTFLRIMEKMLGEPCSSITADLQDGAGELMNIIFGHAKTVLNENGYTIEKAIPKVLTGRELQVSDSSQNPSILIPFENDVVGNLVIEIVVE